MSESKEGWGKSPASKKWHYFVDTWSLCGKIGFYFGDVEQGNDASDENCAGCKRKLSTKRKREASG